MQHSGHMGVQGEKTIERQPVRPSEVLDKV